MLAVAPDEPVFEAPAVIKVPPAPWAAGKAGHCHDNVLEMMQRHGGEAVYGWALAEFGPLTDRGWRAPPLYRRWVNHVVWRDTLGRLWEVSPRATVENHEEAGFQDTEFLPHSSAMPGQKALQDWFRTGTRYVPVRQEGTEAAKHLTLAQAAGSHEEMVLAINNAVSAIGKAGFQPTKVVVQNIAGNTSSIWIYGDFHEPQQGVTGL